MLVEKEVISPGTYFYTDEATGLPRKLVATPELCKYWCDQGNKMIGLGLTIPVPYEHDFSAHPMTPKDKLLNNAGEVREYRLKNGKLFSSVDVQDPDVKGKIGHSIRWTSPWISSFTDGDGRKWDNVISHLALTTRPRITKQAPFGGIAAALSMAAPTGYNQKLFTSKATLQIDGVGKDGFCLSRAGRLFEGKKTKRLRPRYPMAFSMWAGGIKLAKEDAFSSKEELPPEEEEDDDDDDDLLGGGKEDKDDDDDMDMAGLMNPLQDAGGDVKMEELLCDLLQALGVPMPDESNEQEFKRHLYEAAMSKIKELTSKGMAGDDPSKQPPDQNQPTTQQPNASQPNPLIQQEQQPMFMSLEDINKLPDPMKGVALAMYAENQKIRAELDASNKISGGLRDARLKEASAARTARVGLLAKISPSMKADLDAMVAQPAMALSMGDGGIVVDPMAQTLIILEKGLGNLPRLLTMDAASLSVQAQPTDETMLSDAKSDEIAEGMARKMGCAPREDKKAG